MQYDQKFWESVDALVSNSELIIDRPKGTAHPRYPQFIYPVDYGYLQDTTSMDGGGIDVWKGSGSATAPDAILCIVDLHKRDSEIKILLACTQEEKQIIYEEQNKEGMHALLIQRK